LEQLGSRVQTSCAGSSEPPPEQVGFDDETHWPKLLLYLSLAEGHAFLLQYSPPAESSPLAVQMLVIV